MDALADELDRAHRLALLGVVLHPGTCTAGTEDDALSLIAQAIRTVFARQRRRPTMILLEHTAGQGRTVGYRFDHLSTVIERLDGSPRLGVCLDTCHLVASGYDIVSPTGYQSTFAEFDKLVGLARLKVFHGNDSKRPCGARVDRHEHIGRGCLESEQNVFHRTGLHAVCILKSSGRTRQIIILSDETSSQIFMVLCSEVVTSLFRHTKSCRTVIWAATYAAPVRRIVIRAYRLRQQTTVR